MDSFTTIQVDSEVFEFLQKRATPLIDTPNDVLRRLLLNAGGRKEEQSPMPTVSAERPVTAGAFVTKILRQVFGDGFKRRSPYRMMFESGDTLCYFQNFNKKSDHLWYRVTEKPWRYLTSSTKTGWLCLTNPAEGYAYLITVRDVQRHVERAGWSRPYLEINIDPSTSRWTELDWRLEEFLKRM